MKHKWIFVLSAVLLCLLGNGQERTRPVLAQADTASEVLRLVNQVRADHGLPPFRYNQALSVAAHNQANYNAAFGLYGHTGEGGTRPLDRARAAGYQGSVVENVVGGWDLTPTQGVTWWINSPVHYNTLVTTRYEEAGTGYAINGRQRHYTLVVGRPSDALANDAADRLQPAGPPAFVAPIILSEPNEDGSLIHEVKTGQTLWAIAARYDVRLDDLRLFNNLSESSFIRPGDLLTIRLADGASPPPTPTPPFSHIVRQGETLWTIAARYRLALADLLWLNTLDEEAFLQPGDELIIRLAPGQSPPPTPTPKTTHIIQSGESAWAIAALYGLALDDLLAYNDLDRDSLLRPGDQLLLQPPATPTEQGPESESTLVVPETKRSTATATPAAVSQSGPLMIETPLSPQQAIPAEKVSTLEPTPSSVTKATGSGVSPFMLVVAVGFILLAVILAGAAYRER